MMGAHDATLADVTDQIEAGRHLVPEHLWRGVSNHILLGGDTGRFLTSLFENDLINAVCRADEVSLARLHDLVLFLHNYAPSPCFGSRAEVTAWRTAGGIRGGAHLREAA
ncbi:hypothetical protein BH10PSE14_BH10PSE14_04690 [soil metagenome]